MGMGRGRSGLRFSKERERERGQNGFERMHLRATADVIQRSFAKDWIPA